MENFGMLQYILFLEMTASTWPVNKCTPKLANHAAEIGYEK